MSCNKCDFTDTDLNQENEPNNINEECKFCEQEFCGKCFPRHECYGHKKEIQDCDYCNREIILKKEWFIEDEGERFCSPCWWKKPWEKIA